MPVVLLPPPLDIWDPADRFAAILWADFQQTVLKSVLTGYVLGCGLGFVVAIAIDRSPFLQKAPAARQFRLGPARCRHRADHGHVVRLRLPSKVAVVVIMTFLLHAGEHGDGLSAASSIGNGPDAHLCRQLWQR